MHYYKFNIPDWNLGTNHLSLVEEAIYFRLINFYYDTESPIPLETQWVIRRLRLGEHAELVGQILDEFFEKTEKGFVHARCEENIKEYKKTEKKNKLNGAKGGRPRKINASSESQEKPTGFSEETQDEPKHNLNHKPITNNHKPITINHKPVSEERNALNAPDKKTPVDNFFLDDFYLKAIKHYRPDLIERAEEVRLTFKIYWTDTGQLRDDWQNQWVKWIQKENRGFKHG